MLGASNAGRKPWWRRWRGTVAGVAALSLAVPAVAAAPASATSAPAEPATQPIATAMVDAESAPPPEILTPDGDPLTPSDAQVRAEVPPGQTIEIGVASADGPAGLSITTVTATGPEQALAVIDAVAAEPDTLAVGLPQETVPFGSPAVPDAEAGTATEVMAAAVEPMATTTPTAADPFRPESPWLQFPSNQYAPDMLCTDGISQISPYYTGCPTYAWQYATGAGQVVAVLDQGVDTSHPDLAAAVTTGAQCLADGADSCTTTWQVAPDHRSDHGTHVAGVIGAVTDNGTGISGMTIGARIMPVEVIGPDGTGTTTALARGIDWAVDNGATVLNMSLGATGFSDPVLQVAVAHADYLGVTQVAAVGNDGPTSNRTSYPAAYPEVIGVGNIDSAYDIANNSSRGVWVDVVAPGTGILSTLNGDSYGWYSGTSMATPHVAAAVALLRQRQPYMSPADLGDLLTRTAQDLGPSGWDSTFGHGMIWPVSALQQPVKPAPSGDPGSTFYPIDPARVLDTRAGTPAPIQPREAREVNVARDLGTQSEVVPEGAVAIAYNLTIPNPSLSGHLRVMPGDTAYTSASAINVAQAQTIANGLVVKVDANRDIRVYNSVGEPVHAVVDVLGYFLPAEQTTPLGTEPQSTGSRFTPITPTRVHDSDKAVEGRLAPGETRTIAVDTGIDGQKDVIPTGTSAIAYNITVVEPGSAGHLRVMPGDVLETDSSAINWSNPADKIANGLVVKVSPERTIRVRNSVATPVRILVDIVGYYSSDGALFYPVSPARLYDSRQPQPQQGALPPGTERAIYAGDGRDAAGAVTQPNVVPAGSTAMAYNITVPQSGTNTGGHLRLWPDGVARPNASVINWAAGVGSTRANGLIVGVSTQRWVRTYNGSAEPNHVIVDALGYYG